MSYMISTDPSVSSAHMEFDDMLPSTVGRTDETTKLDDVARAGRLQRDQGRTVSRSKDVSTCTKSLREL